MLGLTAQTLQLLRQQSARLPATAQDQTRARLLEKEEQIRRFFRPVPERRVPAARIRLHDDLRLEQILYTGKDFVFVGFGGRADRPLSERRIKRPPLRDVASLLLSFEYAAHAVLFDQVPGVTRRPGNHAIARVLGRLLARLGERNVLEKLSGERGPKALLSRTTPMSGCLLDVFLMERALEEVGRELVERPAWVGFRCA